eukprot:g3864.t1
MLFLTLLFILNCSSSGEITATYFIRDNSIDNSSFSVTPNTTASNDSPTSLTITFRPADASGKLVAADTTGDTIFITATESIFVSNFLNAELQSGFQHCIGIVNVVSEYKIELSLRAGENSSNCVANYDDQTKQTFVLKGGAEQNAFKKNGRVGRKVMFTMKTSKETGMSKEAGFVVTGSSVKALTINLSNNVEAEEPGLMLIDFVTSNCVGKCKNTGYCSIGTSTLTTKKTCEENTGVCDGDIVCKKKEECQQECEKNGECLRVTEANEEVKTPSLISRKLCLQERYSREIQKGQCSIGGATTKSICNSRGICSTEFFPAEGATTIFTVLDYNTANGVATILLENPDGVTKYSTVQQVKEKCIFGFDCSGGNATARAILRFTKPKQVTIENVPIEVSFSSMVGDTVKKSIRALIKANSWNTDVKGYNYSFVLLTKESCETIGSCGYPLSFLGTKARCTSCIGNWAPNKWTEGVWSRRKNIWKTTKGTWVTNRGTWISEVNGGALTEDDFIIITASKPVFKTNKEWKECPGKWGVNDVQIEKCEIKDAVTDSLGKILVITIGEKCVIESGGIVKVTISNKVLEKNPLQQVEFLLKTSKDTEETKVFVDYSKTKVRNIKIFANKMKKVEARTQFNTLSIEFETTSKLVENNEINIMLDGGAQLFTTFVENLDIGFIHSHGSKCKLETRLNSLHDFSIILKEECVIEEKNIVSFEISKGLVSFSQMIGDQWMIITTTTDSGVSRVIAWTVDDDAVDDFQIRLGKTDDLRKRCLRASTNNEKRGICQRKGKTTNEADEFCALGVEKEDCDAFGAQCVFLGDDNKKCVDACSRTINCSTIKQCHFIDDQTLCRSIYVRDEIKDIEFQFKTSEKGKLIDGDTIRIETSSDLFKSGTIVKGSEADTKKCNISYQIISAKEILIRLGSLPDQEQCIFAETNDEKILALSGEFVKQTMVKELKFNLRTSKDNKIASTTLNILGRTIKNLIVEPSTINVGEIPESIAVRGEMSEQMSKMTIKANYPFIKGNSTLESKEAKRRLNHREEVMKTYGIVGDNDCTYRAVANEVGDILNIDINKCNRTSIAFEIRKELMAITSNSTTISFSATTDLHSIPAATVSINPRKRDEKKCSCCRGETMTGDLFGLPESCCNCCQKETLEETPVKEEEGVVTNYIAYTFLFLGVASFSGIPYILFRIIYPHFQMRVLKGKRGKRGTLADFIRIIEAHERNLLNVKELLNGEVSLSKRFCKKALPKFQVTILEGLFALARIAILIYGIRLDNEVIEYFYYFGNISMITIIIVLKLILSVRMKRLIFVKFCGFEYYKSFDNQIFWTVIPLLLSFAAAAYFCMCFWSILLGLFLLLDLNWFVALDVYLSLVLWPLLKYYFTRQKRNALDHECKKVDKIMYHLIVPWLLDFHDNIWTFCTKKKKFKGKVVVPTTEKKISGIKVSETTEQSDEQGDELGSPSSFGIQPRDIFLNDEEIDLNDEKDNKVGNEEDDVGNAEEEKKEEEKFHEPIKEDRSEGNNADIENVKVDNGGKEVEKEKDFQNKSIKEDKSEGDNADIENVEVDNDGKEVDEEKKFHESIKEDKSKGDNADIENDKVDNDGKKVKEEKDFQNKSIKADKGEDGNADINNEKILKRKRKEERRRRRLERAQRKELRKQKRERKK